MPAQPSHGMGPGRARSGLGPLERREGAEDPQAVSHSQARLGATECCSLIESLPALSDSSLGPPNDPMWPLFVFFITVLPQPI